MPAQFVVGQVLPNGNTVVSDIFTENPDGSSYEQVVDSEGNGFNYSTPPTAEVEHQQAMATLMADLTDLASQLPSFLAQGQSDLTELAASTDPLAPILSRAIQSIVDLSQGLSAALVLLGVISPTALQNPPTQS